jgi:hypothetical protein
MLPYFEIGDEAALKPGVRAPLSVFVLEHILPSVLAPRITSDHWTAPLIRIGDASGIVDNSPGFQVYFEL